MKPEQEDTSHLPPLGPTTEPLTSPSEFSNTSASTGPAAWFMRGVGVLAVVGAVG